MPLPDFGVNQDAGGMFANFLVVAFPAEMLKAPGNLRESFLIAVHEIENRHDGCYGKVIGPRILRRKYPEVALFRAQVLGQRSPFAQSLPETHGNEPELQEFHQRDVCKCQRSRLGVYPQVAEIRLPSRIQEVRE